MSDHETFVGKLAAKWFVPFAMGAFGAGISTAGLQAAIPTKVESQSMIDTSINFHDHGTAAALPPAYDSEGELIRPPTKGYAAEIYATRRATLALNAATSRIDYLVVTQYEMMVCKAARDAHKKQTAVDAAVDEFHRLIDVEGMAPDKAARRVLRSYE